MDIHKEIVEWFQGSRDFDAGVLLFGRVTRNSFYLSNLARSRRQSTLEYELGKVLRRAGVEDSLKFRVPSSKLEDGRRKTEVRSQKSEDRRQKSEGTPSVPTTNGRNSSPSDEVDKGRGEVSEQVPEQVSEKSPAQEENARLETARPGLVLRKEFPFLGRDDCPAELKVLVADMITTHDRYVDGHKKLFEVAHKGEDACFEAAHVVVENYLVNRQIWDELEHYKKTGKVLGEHPIFADRKKKAALDDLTPEELEKKIKNLKRQLKYRQDRLKKNRQNEDVAQRRKEIKEIKGELKMLESREKSLKLKIG